MVAQGLPILALMLLVLGGLYGGFFNPTEAGAAGAFGALVIALLRRSLTVRTLLEPARRNGTDHGLGPVPDHGGDLLQPDAGAVRRAPALAEILLSGPVGPYGFLFIYLVLIILLGCLIDSISIMLILLPIALPVAEAAGFDLIWFGVLTVVAVEIGLLTPPFGLSVYTIKSAMMDPGTRCRRDLSRRVPLRPRHAPVARHHRGLPADRHLVCEVVKVTGEGFQPNMTGY